LKESRKKSSKFRRTDSGPYEEEQLPTKKDGGRNMRRQGHRRKMHRSSQSDSDHEHQLQPDSSRKIRQVGGIGESGLPEGQGGQEGEVEVGEDEPEGEGAVQKIRRVGKAGAC
jgi:hypothetical protein